MLLRLIASLMIIVIIHGCATSKIRDREYLTLSGKVIDQSRTKIPANAQLHVLLTESTAKEADDKVIATDSKTLQDVASTEMPIENIREHAILSFPRRMMKVGKAVA